MHRLVVIVALAALLTGCAQERACTDIGAFAGVGVTLQPPLAAGVSRAELEVCWDGRCRRPVLELFPAQAAGQQTCTGSECSAKSTPTGGKYGMAEVPGLPKRRVQVTLALFDEASTKLLDRTVEITPEGLFPNGPECGELGPQGKLVVDGVGNITS
ncbi:hypothetical protein [Nonomuraea sediminis]|uniref:hypothetical protein n=1 Tax=Nonomuraea sediminis TaxID=2835864 RepID=UPI001BDCAB92|nr:hypothetical protein [Nonomuraea sediminis]